MSDPRALHPRTNGRAAWLAPISAAACIALAWFAARARFDPPQVRGLDAHESEFSAARAMRLFDELDGFREPHSVGSRAHGRLRDALIRHLTELGYEPKLQSTISTDGWDTLAVVHNIVVEIRAQASGPAVMLAAHYDSVAAGPGAGDDGAGVVAILEVARALKTEAPLPRSVILCLTDGEELGLLGARAFVREHPLASDVGVVLNFEARGTSGPSMMFETSPDNGWLIEALARSVERPAAVSAAYEVYKRMPNDTDFSVFKRAGMQGLNFAFIGGLRDYHTVRDDVANLDPRSVQHTGDQALALVRELARTPWPHEPRGDLVYFDLLGTCLLSWPPISGAIIAAIALVGLAWHARSLRRDGTLSIASAIWGLSVCLGCIGACVLGGELVFALLSSVRGVEGPSTSHPWPVALAAGALASALALAIIAMLGTRAGFHGMWLGAAFWFAAIALALAVSIPGASYLFLVPSTTALAAALAWRGLCAPRSTVSYLVLTLPLIVAACVCWIPLALAFELSFEWRLPGANCSALGLAFVGAAPTLALVSTRWRWLATVVALVVAVVAGVASAREPMESAERPTALNYVHVQDADGTGARVFAVTYGAPMPALAGRRESWQVSERQRVPSWIRGARFFEADAPLWDEEAPTLTLADPVERREARRVRARVASPRDAAGMILELPDSVRPTRASWRGHEISLDEMRSRTCDLVGFGAEGVDLELDIAGASPVQVELHDVSLELTPLMRELRAATPKSHVQSGAGDRSVIRRTVQL